MTQAHIAKLLGVDPSTISYRLDKAGVKRRSHSEAMKQTYKTGRKKGFAGTRGPGGRKKAA